MSEIAPIVLSKSVEILICQNRSCRNQGAVAVLAAVAEIASDDVIYAGCSCLGKCGNGPNVLVLPAETWYHRVRPQDIPTILADCADCLSANRSH